METVQPRPAQVSERARVLPIALAGFVADPLSRWFWPDPGEYLANAPKMFDAYGGRAFEHESAWTDDEFRGVALWLPPGVVPDEVALGAVVLSTVEPAKLMTTNSVATRACTVTATYGEPKRGWMRPNDFGR